MRGIGAGQKIHIFIIPEVKELMQRELRDAIIPVPGRANISLKVEKLRRRRQKTQIKLSILQKLQ
jgi:hypothetical protein